MHGVCLDTEMIKGVKAMAIFGGNIKTGTVADLSCDSASDVANLPTFADEWNLLPGSTCLCIDTSEVYAMKSDKTWKAL